MLALASNSPGIHTKFCPRCRDTKPIGQFYRDRSRRDGFDVYCRVCRAMYRGEWLEREAELRLDVLPIGKRVHRNRYESKTTPQRLLDRIERLERMAKGEQPRTWLRCGRCGQYKPEDEFHRLLRHRTGRRRQRYCKSCSAEAKAAWLAQIRGIAPPLGPVRIRTKQDEVRDLARQLELRRRLK